jgi:hypothetical protein
VSSPRCSPDACGSPHIKAYLFRLAQESHLTAVGREQQAEHPTDRPAERQRRQLAAQWHAMADHVTVSGETSRADFARSFGGTSNLFCELVNIAQRLNRQKIHVTPPTHQHAIAPCNDCTNVTRSKKPVTMSNFEQRVMSRFAHLIFSKLGGSDAYQGHSC